MTYYTYTHSTPDGDVFYVGKGSGHRAFSTGDRSIAWRKMVRLHDGFAIKIVSRFQTEAEAFEHERVLIKWHREQGASLVNSTNGGRGVEGYCQSEELRKRKAEQLRGYRHKRVTCPHCGFTGGITSTKRWHFDNCQGWRRFKARVSVDGKRVFLGNYPTKIEADMAVQAFLASRSLPSAHPSATV
jgi:predicted GIY-YIG superfamily endonuclease